MEKRQRGNNGRDKTIVLQRTLQSPFLHPCISATLKMRQPHCRGEKCRETAKAGGTNERFMTSFVPDQSWRKHTCPSTCARTFGFASERAANGARAKKLSKIQS
eukprot:INCI2942.3.p1 GENE.INCI2942.3~~INCI2942.3.p1  ORF type:complete len:104 (-),score=7.65 INCI2942.3:5-316(-)